MGCSRVKKRGTDGQDDQLVEHGVMPIAAQEPITYSEVSVRVHRRVDLPILTVYMIRDDPM